MEALRSLSRHFWGPSPPRPSPPPARPFWLWGGEGRPRGVLAATLEELREQARCALSLPALPALALAEDGTLLEDEEFFGSLPRHAELRVLRPGERWEPPEAPPPWDLGAPPAPPAPPSLAPERILRELLRLMTSLTRALGHALLGLSRALRPLLEEPLAPPTEPGHAHSA